MNPHQPDITHQKFKKKCSNLMPLCVCFVVIAEILFLGRLDFANKKSLVNSWADSFYQFTNLPWSSSNFSFDDDDDVGSGRVTVEESSGSESCEELLEKNDFVAYSRDFEKEPVYVAGVIESSKSCAVRCIVGYHDGQKPDGTFGPEKAHKEPTILRSMEPVSYYMENNLSYARRTGYDLIMTTSLLSDVPVGYFSWAEYDIMAPLQPKTENALAAAFISNCVSRNFRLEALEGLKKANITVDSYGACHGNRDGKVNKVDALKRYKFSLAFENSNEEDYVTEKYFQSLVAGTIPVVVGAPNIQDFAPLPGSVLHIKEVGGIDSVAKTMKYLADHPDAYNRSLRWKFEGPSDSFKALIDMAAVHSSCRLCIHIATNIRAKEEKNSTFSKRPCKCTRGLETVYHVYVRERGRFEMESIFIRSGNLTLKALESAVMLKFKSLNHVPVWKEERPVSIRGTDELKLYRVYPLGLTQREALYTFSFKGDEDLKRHIEKNPCAKFEVIFV
ncbi:glycoprotein 3-alpha-L-fucosyltransferase A-like isoform X1 [Apium graveolens]|uniref:glycoprotein 3-alpha-L-fucosyltransferase A-like isoform X1 n=1 Tax=Apium graveolens TaxID=4045 RepID=UPI003D7B3CD0